METLSQQQIDQFVDVGYGSLFVKRQTCPGYTAQKATNIYTDVMSRTAEGSFPEAALYFVADDQITQRNLDEKALILPTLINPPRYLS